MTSAAWSDVVLAVLAAGAATSFADWYFFGVLFHEKYLAFPEVWRRPRGGPGETRAIGISTAASLLTPVVLVYLVLRFRLTTADAQRVAVALWLAAPVPILVSQYLFIKIHPLTVTAHALGWLVKLMISAAIVSWLVSSR